MNKKTLSYHYNKEYAIKQVIEILGDYTIVDCIGAYKGLEMKTFQITKFINGEIPKNFVHDKAKEFKNIFRQESVITEVTASYNIDFHDYSPEYEKEIQEIMTEYYFDWDTAVDLYHSGLY